jgi:hypothetical protein
MHRHILHWARKPRPYRLFIKDRTPKPRSAGPSFRSCSSITATVNSAAMRQNLLAKERMLILLVYLN